MAVSSLGEFDFITFNMVSGNHAPPLLPGMQVQPIQRGGVDDTTFVRLGTKGDPFQMISFRDEDDLQAALDLMKEYVDSKGTDPMTLIWAGIDFETDYETKYVVLDVVPLHIAAIRTASGGLSNLKGAILYALWTLIPVEAA